MEYRLVVTESSFKKITVSDDPSVEHLVYSFGSISRYGDVVEFVLRDSRILRNEEYLHRSAGLVETSHELAWEVWHRSSGYGVLISSHTHLGSSYFSSTDDAQDFRICHNVLGFCDNYVRIVSGADGIVAEVISCVDKTWKPVDLIKIVGRTGMRWVTPKNSSLSQDCPLLEEAVHDRTLRLGPGAREALESISRCTFGFVGAGGGNSVVAQFLKFYSPAGMIFVDPDRVEIHNANRFLGFRKGDVGRFKVKVLAREIRQFDPEIKVRCCRAFFPEGDSVEALKAADVLVSFPDNDATRYDLAVFAARFHKPLFDAGTLISYAGGLEPCRITARVLSQLPEGPCLHCLGVEGGYGPRIEEEVRQAQASYSDRPDLAPAPQVVTTNAFAASLVVRNILSYFYPGLVSHVPAYLQFEELEPSVQDLSHFFPRRPGCPVCGDGFEAERGWADSSPLKRLLQSPVDDGGDSLLIANLVAAEPDRG
jgi:molybdopterin/thiamine biosynthesis adenylyltransferase